MTKDIASQGLSDEFKKRFFEGMSFAAATVNVVTTEGTHGKGGVTVSAMSSVSADTPNPTLLVCVNEKSASAETILRNGVFCVNVLRDHQSVVSDTFAGRYKERWPDKFSCTEWEYGDLGVPRVRDALVSFDCRISSTIKIGTHHVIFGEVEDIQLGRQGSSLVYSNRAYGSAMKFASFPSSSAVDGSASDKIGVGCFHTFAPFVMPRIVAALANDVSGPTIQLVEGDNRLLEAGLLSGEIDLALIYGFEAEPALEVEELVQLEPYVLLPQGHKLTELDEITVEDLAGEPMISVADSNSADFLEGILRQGGVEPHVALRSSSFEMVRGLVGHGLGYAIVMTKPASSMTYDGMTVVSKKLRSKARPGRVVLARRKDDKANEMIERVRDLTLRQFR